MEQPIVLYHGNCWDGFCAAWLLHRAFPDGEFIPVQYGQEPPEVANDKHRQLFVVDFSYPRNVMFSLGAMRPGGLIVLDHHKTAEAALQGLSEELTCNNCGDCEVIFDMEKSGARITWEWLWDNVYGKVYRDITDFVKGQKLNRDNAPWLVDYTEDRDLWRWKLPHSREVTTGLRSYPLDFDVWDKFDLSAESVAKLINDGTAILRSEKTIIDNHVRHAREVELDGHKILAVNATVLFSDIAGELAKGRPFGAAYFDRGDGKRQWSLRSTDDGVDVSEIAKTHGGGGHRNAAGFEQVMGN